MNHAMPTEEGCELVHQRVPHCMDKFLTADCRSCRLQEEAQQIAEQLSLDATLAPAQHKPDAAHILAPMTETGKQVAGLPGTRATGVKDIIATSAADREPPR